MRRLASLPTARIIKYEALLTSAASCAQELLAALDAVSGRAAWTAEERAKQRALAEAACKRMHSGTLRVAVSSKHVIATEQQVVLRDGWRKLVPSSWQAALKGSEAAHVACEHLGYSSYCQRGSIFSANGSFG